MEKAEKTKTFKGTFAAIKLFLELTDSNINYSTKFGQNYYKIIQNTKNFKKIEYHVEYLLDYDVIRLDLHCSIENAKIIKNYVYKALKLSSKINLEQFKFHVTFNGYFKFQDIGQINSIAMLMIEIDEV